MRLIILTLSLLAAVGCVKAATSTIGLAAGVGGAAVKTTANAASAGVKAVIPDEEKRDHHGRSDDNDPRPFDASRDAMLDVDAALDLAQRSGKRVLLVLGANWCHDSRGLAGKFEDPALADLIDQHYELVWVDVGRRDRNLHVAMRFGVAQLLGTPTVLILSPEGELLNADSVHDWRTADSKPFDETFEYFQAFSGGEE